MFLLILKFLCAIVGIFATTLYISSIFTSVSFNSMRLPGVKDEVEDTVKAKFRLVVGAIMAVCWGVLIVF